MKIDIKDEWLQALNGKDIATKVEVLGSIAVTLLGETPDTNSMSVGAQLLLLDLLPSAQRAADIATKRREAGKKGGESRWTDPFSDPFPELPMVIETKPKPAPTPVPRFSFRSELIKAGVPEDLADDYMKVRRAKRAADTLTAFKGLVREIGKAGISFKEAIQMCVEKSWQGFRAEWYERETNHNGNSRKSIRESADQRWLDGVADFTRTLFAGDGYPGDDTLPE